MRELNSEALTQFISRNTVTRLHIIPSKNNQDILRAHKKIILLRSPIEVLLSFRRSINLGLHARPVDFSFCDDSDAAWISRAERIGLIEDMQMFVDKWKEHDGDKYVVYFENLVKDTSRTFMEIENYFGLDPSNVSKLRKENFYRSRIYPIRLRFPSGQRLQHLRIVRKARKKLGF